MVWCQSRSFLQKSGFGLPTPFVCPLVGPLFTHFVPEGFWIYVQTHAYITQRRGAEPNERRNRRIPTTSRQLSSLLLNYYKAQKHKADFSSLAREVRSLHRPRPYHQSQHLPCPFHIAQVDSMDNKASRSLASI